MTVSSFSELGLIEPLQRAIREENYTTPTPIQIQAIPSLLEGRDLMGCAQTGTGKTAAFALPILQILSEDPRPALPRAPRALVLTPTRELAAQVAESFRVYGRHAKLTCALVFGGVRQDPQVRALAKGVDVLVATPGRLLDLMQQRKVELTGIEIFVLDEADRMLDMGFLPDVRRIIATLPKKRQTLFFSATMPYPVVYLSQRLLTNPVRIDVSPAQPTADRIEQKVMFVDKANKFALLADMLRGDTIGRVLIFTRTKYGADKLVRNLERARIPAEAIHGDKTQSARTQALELFREGSARVLVATDIAARGIDIDGITHVINYDIPQDPESYIHRIGRTARAGASGVAFSFCDSEEKKHLRDIESLIRRPIPVADDHSFHNVEPVRRQLNGLEKLSGARYVTDDSKLLPLAGERREPQMADRNKPVERKAHGAPETEATPKAEVTRKAEVAPKADVASKADVARRTDVTPKDNVARNDARVPVAQTAQEPVPAKRRETPKADHHKADRPKADHQRADRNKPAPQETDAYRGRASTSDAQARRDAEEAARAAAQQAAPKPVVATPAPAERATEKPAAPKRTRTKKTQPKQAAAEPATRKAATANQGAKANQGATANQGPTADSESASTDMSSTRRQAARGPKGKPRLAFR